MNLYRGCTHDCAYCDGRAENYYVEGEFGRDLTVKTNAIEILSRELNPARKRKPFGKGFILMGGGVTDGYQSVESKYKLTRQALELALKFGHPVHVLTKSTLVERDLDLIKEINKKSRAIVSMSFSSVDEGTSQIFEPGVPPPQERLISLAKFRQAGISAGMFLMPVIPFITDTPQMLGRSVEAAKQAGLNYIIFGGMTLKEGRQKQYFDERLTRYFPDLLVNYDAIYNGDKWGSPSSDYSTAIHQAFSAIAWKYRIPARITPDIYSSILDINSLVTVILEQVDYFMRQRGQKSPYGFAAYSVSQLGVPVSDMRTKLTRIKGVGKETARLILEIIDTKSCSLYEKLLYQNKGI